MSNRQKVTCETWGIERCDDRPCKGHLVTKRIDQAARVLAWADGWDVMEESDQCEEYWTHAALALREIGRPFNV